MAAEIREYATFQKIRRPDGTFACAGFKYLHSLENAKKIALFDCLSAATLASDGEDPSSAPQLEFFAGKVNFAAIIHLEQERGNYIRLTETAAGRKIIRLCDGQSLTAPPPMTDVHKLVTDEYGEMRWTPEIVL